MLKKILFLSLSLVLLLGTLSGCFITEAISSGKPRTFESADGVYSFYISGKWKQQDETFNESSVLSLTQDQNSDSFSLMVLPEMKIDFTDEVDLAFYNNKVIENYRVNNTDFEIKDEREFEIGGKKAFRTNFFMTKQGAKVTLYIYTLEYDDRFIQIAGGCLQSKTVEGGKLFDEAAESFKMKTEE